MRILVALALVLSALCGAGRGWASLRFEAEGVAPFELREWTVENTTAWYDAETWLRHFPGSVEWSAKDGRLTHRDGGHWAALRAEAPYALRDGRALRSVDPPQLKGGRLLVTGRFLRESAAELLGRAVRVLESPVGPARRVVLDPGHGGPDTGSRGPPGALEKDVVLELARAVAEGLRRSGFEVHLTRTGDVAMEDAQRAAVANFWAADLFLSLHVSGEGRPRARGFEALVVPPPPPGADGRRWEAGQVGSAERSRAWAEGLLAALGEVMPTFDRGLAVAPNPVLEAVACPAALLEVGSLAWPQDLDWLRSAAGRTALAGAVAQSAEAFLRADGARGQTP